jgi:hypothetical protein
VGTSERHLCTWSNIENCIMGTIMYEMKTAIFLKHVITGLNIAGITHNHESAFNILCLPLVNYKRFYNLKLWQAKHS